MSVHPFRLFASYRSVKLYANMNIKVKIQQLSSSAFSKNCYIQNVDLNSWNKFVQTCLQSKKFFFLPNFKYDFCECERMTFFDIIRFNEHGKIDANCKSVFIDSFFGYLFIKMKQKKWEKRVICILFSHLYFDVGLDHRRAFCEFSYFCMQFSLIFCPKYFNDVELMLWADDILCW